MIDSKVGIAPWRKRFLNVVERTIIELNIEFINYSIGQAASGETKRRIFDKAIQGIEFADELSVCSAIVNDCIASPIISGDVELFDDQSKTPELKFYKIGREVPYDENSLHRVDITVQRVSYEQIIENAKNKDVGKETNKIDSYRTSYIEAKRAKRYPNSTLEKVSTSGTWTYNELRSDIELKIDKYDSPERFFYILVWGVWDKKIEKDNTPEKYLAEFRKSSKFKIDDKDDIVTRWIPLSWDSYEKIKTPDEKLEIEKWCWILLVQVTK